MRKSKKMVEENIASLSSSLETLVPGTEEYSKAAESLAKLYKVVSDEEVKFNETSSKTKLEDKKYLQEEKRLEMDKERLDLEKDTRKSEEEFKKKQLNRDFWHNMARIGVDLGLGLSAFIAGCYFTSRGFKYEETGVYKSDAQKKLMSNWNIFRRR